MEVLEHGWVYDKNRNIIKCECECKYKYSDEDIKSSAQRMLDDDCKWFYFIAKYVECPECGEKYWFDERIPMSKEEYFKMRERIGTE